MDVLKAEAIIIRAELLVKLHQVMLSFVLMQFWTPQPNSNKTPRSVSNSISMLFLKEQLHIIKSR